VALVKVERGYSNTVRAGLYPEGHEKAGKPIQFRITLVTERDKAHAQACMDKLLAMRDALVKAKRGLEAETLIRDAALVVDQPQMFETALAVASMIEELPPMEEPQGWRTWGQLADAWASGEAARRHPGKNLDKQDSERDQQRIDWLKPFIGDVALEAFTEEHYNLGMANLPRRCKTKTTRRHYSQVILRVMRIAKKLKLVKAWKLDEVEPIKILKKDRPVFTCLFPADLNRLLPSELLDYQWRLLWGFMIYESPRIGKLREVRWRHIEKDGNGAISMDSKSGEMLYWDLRPGTLEALLHMRELDPKSTGPFSWMSDTQQHQAAKLLRDHLELVGCDREALFENEGRRRKLRAHDTRASFVVFAKLEGRSEQWIMDRTGHTTSEMVQRYDRVERVAEGKGWAPLGRLDRALGLGLTGPSPDPQHISDGKSDTAPVSDFESAPEGPNGSVAEGAQERTGAERGAGCHGDLGPTVTPAVTVGVPCRVSEEEQTMQVVEKVAVTKAFRCQDSNLDKGIQRPSFSVGSASNADGSIERDTPEGSGSDQLSRLTVTPGTAYAVALKRAMQAAIEAEAMDDLDQLRKLFATATAAAGGAKVVDLAMRRRQG
jgi:integrase